MTGLNVVVVRATVEPEMPGSRGLAGVRVVGDFVGPQDVGAVMDLGVAVQFVDIAVFFLLESADGSRILVLGNSSVGTH
jgi:hypothetical protein